MRQICKLKTFKSSLRPKYLCQEHPVRLLSMQNVFHPLYRRIHYSSYTPSCKSLYIDPVVTKALWKKAPVVALESTIITHGMPFPHNVR